MDRSRTLDEALDRFEETHRRKVSPQRARWMDVDECRGAREREMELDYLHELAERTWEKQSHDL